jgi:hypothetical protein
MRKILLFLVLGLLFSVIQSHAQDIEEGITLRKFGKGGATNESGQWKICPEFSLKTCATYTITWQDIKDWLFDRGTNPPVIVVVFDENEQAIETLIRQGEIIDPHRFNLESSLNGITANDIIIR